MPRFHWFFNPLREAEGVAGGTPPAAPAVPPTGEGVAPASQPIQGETPATSPAESEPAGNGSLIPEVEGEAKPEGEATPPEEPLKVEDLKLPEGMTADDPGLKALVETLGNKDLKPSERAQALLDTYKENIQTVGAAVQAKMAADYKAINDGWVAAVKADPVISKPEAQAVVAKALDTYGDGKELRKVFALTGAGNNPHVIKLLHTMASALAEGRPANGGVPQGKKSMGELFYGTPPASV